MRFYFSEHSDQLLASLYLFFVVDFDLWVFLLNELLLKLKVINRELEISNVMNNFRRIVQIPKDVELIFAVIKKILETFD